MAEIPQAAHQQKNSSPTGPAWLILYAFAIGSTILAEYHPAPFLKYAPSLIFSLGLVFSVGFWIRMRSGLVAVITGAVSLMMWSSTDLPVAAIASEVAKFNGTICLLISMPVMRMAFVHGQLHQEVVDLLGRVANQRRMNVLLISSVFTGLGLSFGTVGVLGAALEGRSNPAAATAGTIMRGIVITMLIAPTTGSVAVVMSTFPSVMWSDTLKLGIPLAVAALFLGLLQRGHVNVTKHPFEKLGYAGHQRLMKFASISIITTLGCHFGLAMSMISAICMAALVTGCMWLIAIDRCKIRHFILLSDAALWRASKQLTPEIALFLSCGLISVVIRQPIWQEYILSWMHFLNQPGLIGVATIVLGVPLLTVCGIHPMVPFSILSPIITPAGMGLAEPALYTMWIIVFMLSMLISPASVLNILTASSFNMSTWSLSVKAHAIYAGAFGIVGIAVLQFSSMLLS